MQLVDLVVGGRIVLHKMGGCRVDACGGPLEAVMEAFSCLASECSVQSKTVPCRMRINTNTVSLDIMNLSGWGISKIFDHPF